MSRETPLDIEDGLRLYHQYVKYLLLYYRLSVRISYVVVSSTLDGGGPVGIQSPPFGVVVSRYASAACIVLQSKGISGYHTYIEISKGRGNLSPAGV